MHCWTKRDTLRPPGQSLRDSSKWPVLPNKEVAELAELADLAVLAVLAVLRARSGSGSAFDGSSYG
jgi:hypothetical protein